MGVCLKAVVLCEVEVCIPSACYKQIMEAVNRVNIAVLTDGETWGGGGEDTQKREMQKIQLRVQKKTEGWGERGVNEGSYTHKVAIVCN